MTSQPKITAIRIDRSIINPRRLSENATITFEVANLLEDEKVSVVTLHVRARERSNREIADEARRRLLERIESLAAQLQSLESFLPPDWS